jgi:hypothetical protein
MVNGYNIKTTARCNKSAIKCQNSNALNSAHTKKESVDATYMLEKWYFDIVSHSLLIIIMTRCFSFVQSYSTNENQKKKIYNIHKTKLKLRQRRHERSASDAHKNNNKNENKLHDTGAV